MSPEDAVQGVTLVQQERFCFEIRFGTGGPVWLGDESPPLGQGKGPTPAQLLVAAVSSCLADALYFALHKFNPDLEGALRAEGQAGIGRNPAGRLRVLEIRVALHLPQAAARYAHLDRTLGQFEEFCTVGRSVAQGIPVRMTVVDAAGAVLKAV
ncbi:OsmC family protein [Ferrovum sp.]|uniref:OsmC family protein n=1 Tax=Ferrovum sp. TaxID=2609467 RepID=UPI0026361600|nr:OsmC family protein [Ferrovum sp.]